MSDAIAGWTEEDESEFRSGLLSITPDKLIRAAQIIRDALSFGTVCVAGGKDIITSFKNPLEETVEL